MTRVYPGELWSFCFFMKIPENTQTNKSLFLPQMTPDPKNKGFKSK